MSIKTYSTHQAARICDVHISTIINWMNEGRLKGYTTLGGHRRIERDDLVSFMREHRMPIPEELARKTRKILIVDDDKVILDELKEALGGSGYDVQLASEGFAAARSVYKEKPDMILLDFKMPGLDGFGVCEMLRMDEETKNIPIIAITVLDSEEDIKNIKKCGVKKYMQKPINIDKLIGALHEFLG